MTIYTSRSVELITYDIYINIPLPTVVCDVTIAYMVNLNPIIIFIIYKI